MDLCFDLFTRKDRALLRNHFCQFISIETSLTDPSRRFTFDRYSVLWSFKRNPSILSGVRSVTQKLRLCLLSCERLCQSCETSFVPNGSQSRAVSWPRRERKLLVDIPTGAFQFRGSWPVQTALLPLPRLIRRKDENRKKVPQIYSACFKSSQGSGMRLVSRILLRGKVCAF